MSISWQLLVATKLHILWCTHNVYPMTEAFEKEKVYSVDEYFALDEQSEEKLEYYNGKIKVMSGGTAKHNEIAARIIAILVNSLEQSEIRYRVYTSDTKIQIPSYSTFVYPDAVVVSLEPEFYEGRKDIITNPLLVVEVLSPSTQNYDRDGKFLAYRTLPSFREYMLIDQDRPQVTTFFRNEARHWEDNDIIGMDKNVMLRSVNCEIPLSRIYKNIDLSA
jgi:Uma2 family endonuclease